MDVTRTLGGLLTDLRLELGFSDNSSVGQNYDATLKYHLNAEYERLWNDFQWPHLWGTDDNGWFDVETQAGERYYDYPDGMDPLSVKKVWYKYADSWAPLSNEVTPGHYNAFDSDDDENRNDPAMAWRQHTAEQFELWPIPATDGLTIRFEGRRAFAKLVDNSDVCFLDGQLIVLAAATRIKSTRKGETGYASSTAKLYRRHYAMLKHRLRKKKVTAFAPPVTQEVQLPRVTVAYVRE